MVDKAALREEFQKKWKKYYNMPILTDEGFKRQRCKKCSRTFWAAQKKDTCGDAECVGQYTFIGKSPAKVKLNYSDTWKRFSKHMSKLGYTEIPRYPVVARWRDDTWFTQASIYCFQPYVVSGEVKPPANPLIIPQPSLRFNDIENVGVTGSHYTTHVHVGQHAFVPPKDYKPNRYLSDIHSWLIKGMKIPKSEITYHEDVWAGGGNFGPSMEYFVGGIELGNQVYMQFKDTPAGPQRLKINVLDHGGGLERWSWITQGVPTSYQVVFDPIDNKYLKKLGLKRNVPLIKKFAKFGGRLNFDEVEDMDKAWKSVAEDVGTTAKELKDTLQPFQAYYSILDHIRTLVFALADGALPSNSGGGYNLRFILRRALRLNQQYGWNIDILALARDMANALRPLYPGLCAHIPTIEKLLEVELAKYDESKIKSTTVLNALLKKKPKLNTSDLIHLYDSHGLVPEDAVAKAKALGAFVEIPKGFYSMVAERHTQPRRKAAVQAETVNVAPTKLMYHDDEYAQEFTAKVLKRLSPTEVILDKTLFYAVSGGQAFDIGTINNIPVVGVKKQNQHIIHELESPLKAPPHSKVIGKIEWKRRYNLMKHHTATHIINGVAKSSLGEHIWQAGSEVHPDKARLDITHYEHLTHDQLLELERKANEVEQADIKLNKKYRTKDEAEAAHGFRLYQGGVPPGSSLRVVEIPGIDVEACGGTHVNSTGEVGYINITGAKKIQDGVLRIEFSAGPSAVNQIRKMKTQLRNASDIFSVQPEQLPKTCERFFTEWKAQKKEIKKLKKK